MAGYRLEFRNNEVFNDLTADNIIIFIHLGIVLPAKSS